MIFQQEADDRKVRVFSLSSSFLEQFKGRQPKWGPVGFLTYKRTYSRDLPDGGTEEFWQTCQRVVEGCFNIQKIHCRQMGLPWVEQKAQGSAQDMFERMWDFKFSPPGRGLWIMGTDLVYQRGSASLQNCAFVSSENIGEDFAAPFCFLMDMSMLGVGVGGDTKGVGKAKLVAPRTTLEPHVVEDSREGWVELIRTVLNSFVGKGHYPLVIDYSQVRGRGTPIKTFGGIASGPKPLAGLVENLTKILLPTGMKAHHKTETIDDWATIQTATITLEGEGDSRRISSAQIVDIFNFIGKAVVAGGVRRCLPAGTLVHTSEGLIPIERVRRGLSVVTSDGYSKVTDWVDQGVQPISQITTQMGVFECTDKHQIAVLSDIRGGYIWKMAKELGVGDRMVFVDHVLEGTPTELPPYSYDRPLHSTTCKDITIPELDSETGWFLGLLHGDGYVRLTSGKGLVSIAIAEGQEAILERAKAVFRRFGVNTGIIGPKEDDRCFKLRASSKQLADYFSQFKQAHVSIDVPDCILQGTPSVRAGYVAGLFDADGSSKNRPLVVAASVYPDYLKQVQAVLASLGVPSRFQLHKDKSRVPNGWQPLYYLTVVGEKAVSQWEKRVVPFASKYCNGNKTPRSQNDYGFPSAMVLDGGVSGWADGGMVWSRTSRQMTVARLESVTGREVTLVPVAILGVEHAVREDETYDLSVAANEFVVQGGYLVHNTAEIMFGEPDDQDFITLKQDQEALADRRWACVTGDTMVETSLGFVPIQSLVGKKGLQARVNGKFYPVAGVKKTGHKPIFRISTLGGQSLRVSGNHPLMTRQGWVRAENLQVDDWLVISDNRTSCLDEVLPTSQEYQRGYLLGSLIGDGSYVPTHPVRSHIARIVIYVGDSGCDSLRNYISQIFNFPTRSDFRGFSGPHGKGTRAYWFISAKAFTDFAHQWGVKRGNKTLTSQMESGSLSFVAGVASGLFDADGYVMKKRRTLAIDQSCPILLERLQRMLFRLGITSRVHKVRNAQCKDFQGKIANCKAVYRLILAGHSEAARFVSLCGIHHQPKLLTWQGVGTPSRESNLPPLYFKVTSINKDPVEAVFDMSVPEVKSFSASGFLVHNSNNSIFGYVGMNYAEVARSMAVNGEPGIFWLDNARKFSRMGHSPDNKDWRVGGTNPCGEQSLESWELCNLVETYPAHHDTYEDFERTLKMAYLYAKTVTLVPTHDPRANAVMMRNRRIGCSMSGIVQAMARFGRRDFLNWCDRGYTYVQKLDRIYSDWLGIPLSIKTTTCKPSGTVSLLCGATPGIHYPHSEYYIRRVRIQATSPLIKICVDAGYPVEPDVVADDTVVVSFPVKEKLFVKGKEQVTVWEQFANAAALQHHWTDNQVSITVSFGKDEVEDLQACLEMFEDKLKAVSVLPLGDHGYKQAPYEAITEAEYTEMTARITPMLLDSVHHDTDDSFCSGDKCMLPVS